jgi:adenosine deaminase
VNTMKRIVTVLIFAASAAGLFAPETAAAAGAGTPEQRAARFFDTLRQRPAERLAFLLDMPKGADLHNHLSGAVYAETFVRWAAAKALCVNQTTFVLTSPPCNATAGLPEVSTALTDGTLFGQIIDSWSMRNWEKSGQNGHDHFFDTFGKFGLAGYGQTGAMLAEVLARAARGRVSYMELMLTPDNGASTALGLQAGWNGDFEGTLADLTARGIASAATQAKQILRDAEAQKDALLKCGTPQADPGCTVTVRYVSQVSRGSALGPVFAQMVTGFALANDPDSKVVALNLVQPEDGLSAMQNFGVHMQMLKFLRPRYPRAHLTLHAGELAPGLVPPDGLSFHIRDSIEVAGAERIGHGVDILHETGAIDLLQMLARRRVMVEICLTSNDGILGVRGRDHPLATYLHYGVPVSISTDDEGVARSEISMEYLKAANEQGLGYVQLKKLARTGLEYAFVSGASVWRDARKFAPVRECAANRPGQANPSATCAQFLAGSEKARLQWALERDFTAFERRY